MAQESHRAGPGDEERKILVDLLGEFADEVNEGQAAAVRRAAKRAISSEKARPLREIVRDIDAANGGLLSRAVAALTTKKGNPR